MDRGAWQATVHEVTKSWPCLSDSLSLTHTLCAKQTSSVVYSVHLGGCQGRVNQIIQDLETMSCDSSEDLQMFIWRTEGCSF